MKTVVKLTNEKYLDSKEREVVITMCHNGKETTTFNDSTIHLVSHKKTDDELEIVVKVENE